MYKHNIKFLFYHIKKSLYFSVNAHFNAKNFNFCLRQTPTAMTFSCSRCFCDTTASKLLDSTMDLMEIFHT